MKLGMIDLDTSHPASWLPILREMGHDVVCVHDGGTVYPEGYAAQFAAEHGIETACDGIEAMLDEVDAVIIHSANWDLHVERARPFVEAGIPVLIDKPLVGNVADARTLIEWARSGKVVTGGSSLRYAYEVRDLLARPAEELGKIHAAFTGCSVDEFSYGIHAFSLMWGICGPGAVSVRWLGAHVQNQYEITWLNGRRGIVTVGETPGYLPVHATVLTSKKVVQLQPDPKRMYQALLEHELPILEGRAVPPDVEELLEPELAAIAGLTSKRSRGGPVTLAALSDEHPGFDGAAFGRKYRDQRLPAYFEEKRRKT